MAKKHSFAKGLATGVLGTAATVSGAVFAVKKTICKFCYTFIKEIGTCIHRFQFLYNMQLEKI